MSACVCVCDFAVQACATGVNSMATLQLVLLLSECLVFWCVCRLAVQALCNELASEHGNSASTMVFAVNLLWCCACACATCGSGERWNVSCCGRLSSQQRRKRYHLSCQLLVLCVCVCVCDFAVQAMQPVGQLSTVGLPVVFPLRSVPLSIFNDRSLRSHLP
jgi:Mn2+/Fe2+ NRAMP family transporter